MKSYLDLVSLSSKVNRKKSRLTRICIVLAVLLVSSIFGMADMEIRCQKAMAIQDDGAWHAAFRNITAEQAAFISSRPEVEAGSFYACMNYRLDQDYSIEGKKAAVCGFDESFLDLYPAAALQEGHFPQKADEAAVTQSVQKQLKLHVGDQLKLSTPDQGILTYTITGFTGDTSLMTKWDAFGVFLNKEGYLRSFASETLAEDFVYYVAFKPFCPIQKTLDDICTQLAIPETQVSQNTKLLGLMLQSDNDFILKLYLSAVVLVVLVIISGVLMIANSLHTMVARRTEFFGMLRCLGACPKQIVRYVRMEALCWCRISIPVGLGISVVMIWGLCGVLRYLSPSYFAGMPLFRISWIGLVSGAAVGLLTVLLAARSPAKKASRVSPLTAVSGNAGTVMEMKKAARGRFLKIPAALGVHHACSSKKNLLFMSGSYAFSIILFLAFTTAVDFMHHGLTPLRPYTPDLSIYSEGGSPAVSEEIVDKVKENPAVKKSYGRLYSDSVILRQQDKTRKIHMTSYESLQFQWARKSLVDGSLKEAEEGKGVLIDFPASQYLTAGEKITLETAKGSVSVPVTGVLSDTPFSSSTGIVICSEQLFSEITGIQDYAVLDIQLNRKVSEQDIDELRNLAGTSLAFSDQRADNQEVRSTYFAFALFIYGFLFIIALIAVFHIINSIGMSVSSRMPLFGAMRAVGMTVRQLVCMIISEAAVYVGGGIFLGLLAGLPVNYVLYSSMITSHWGDPWKLPVSALSVIVILTLASLLPAIAEPTKRIREMSVVDTIHEQ